MADGLCVGGGGRPHRLLGARELGTGATRPLQGENYYEMRERIRCFTLFFCCRAFYVLFFWLLASTPHPVATYKSPSTFTRIRCTVCLCLLTLVIFVFATVSSSPWTLCAQKD